MGKFNLEDYRHPWETGPHWELKKEFMEKYSDMFPEDRLLCLAQAYSNIVLMNCSYPDPVMRQVSLLSEPLQMRKRFQESSTSGTESKEQKGKRKNANENSEKPCKFIKFCASKEQLASSFESNSSILDKNVLESPTSNLADFSNVSAADNLLNDPQPFESNSDVVAKDDNQIPALNPSVQDEQRSQNIVIASTLGLDFIKNFVSEVRKFQAKALSASESIISAAQKLKIMDQVSFKINNVPNRPPHAPLFCSELSINGCIISSEEESSKKKAKAKCAETALDTLIEISGEIRADVKNKVVPGNNLSSREFIKNDQFVKEKCMDMKNSLSNPSVKYAKKFENSGSVVDIHSIQNSSFILNQTMLDASVKDGFVLLYDLSLKAVSQRNARVLFSSSAGFCRKHFEYIFDEVPETNPPLTKVSVVLGKDIVATGTASTKVQAKIIACDNAIEFLKKKYYTLKVKSEYNDGYIISRNQVFEGESFSSNVITENNIGCKMLKSMGWTGGGLGTSGIAEPVEAQGYNSFGSGLGYKRGNTDIQLFKKRINSMLQDYSKTDTLSGLVFSKEFAKEERKEIHRIALKYNLHTASQGSNESRFLTVRHKYTATQVLLYLAKNGGSNSKFELVDATNVTFETNI